MREGLKWALSGLGAGGAVGGGATGALVGGLTGPQGALIGMGVGAAVGGVYAYFFETTPEVMTQGKARDYLLTKRSKYPDLPVEAIMEATNYPKNSSAPDRGNLYVQQPGWPAPIVTSDAVALKRVQPFTLASQPSQPRSGRSASKVTLTPADPPSSKQDQTRKPHSASLVARGFGPPRLSYACRRPKLFRMAAGPLKAARGIRFGAGQGV